MNLLSSTSIFTFYTLLSRIFGYLRDILIAIFLGTTIYADAFFVAFRIPNTFRRLFSEGTFNSAFVPSYMSELQNGKDNSNKLVAKKLEYLVNNVKNTKFVLLSATPMFNDYKEIIFLINLLNSNDNRSTINIKDVFNSDDTFITDGENEIGKDLLRRKLNGYVSYVKGDNPFIFPYRILPELFAYNNSIKNKEFKYPILNIIQNRLEENQKINFFDIFLCELDEYQEKVYNYILNKSEFNEESDSYKYTLLLKPLESLNIVYPNEELDSTSMEEINSLNLDEKI